MRIHSPQITGSAENTNIVTVTRITSLSALSASFASTASFVQNAQSASFAITASHLLGQSPTSSYALTASFVSNALSASFAATASSADNLTVRGTLTAQTINVQTITSSIDYVTGSSINGSLLANTHQFTGSVNITGSLQVNESNVILTNQTSSISVATASYWSGSIINAATASYVENAQSASYVLQAQSASYWSGSIINAATASYVENAQSASYVLQAQSASYWSGSIINAATASYVLNAVSASFALTASYISGSGAGVGFPFSGSAIITGSLFVSGSTISGSFKGDGSQITGLTAGGKIHTQTSAASTWTVSHNLGVQYPNVTVYDNNNNVIIPQTIVATDANTLTLTFGSAVAGYAVAGIGGIINVQGRTTQQYFTASTTWSFAHNLGDKYVSLQAFDDAFEMMIPTTIRLVDFTSSLLLFDSASSGYAVATIGGDLPAISSSYAGYTLQVASSAPYSASWVAVPNITVTNAVSSSFAATASSADNLTVRGTLTAQTINVQTITSSIEFVTGSTRNGSIAGNTHQFTGSVLMSGSVGIGTSSPSQKLHISDSTSVYCRIVNTAGADVYLGSESTQGVLSVNNNLPLDVRTNNVTRLYINTSGSIGIGITPNTGWNSFTTLQLGGNTYSALASSNHYLNIAANSYYDGTNFRYISNGFTSRYQLSDGTHLWYVAGSGTAGNTINYTNVMTITNTGQIALSNSPGIRFVSGSSDLNYYTTSTWTPQFAAGGTTSFGLASQTGTGRYTRIGNVVTIHGQIVWNGAGSSGTNLLIQTLPFRVAGNVRGGIGMGLISGIGDIYPGGLQLVPELNSFVMYLITHNNDGSGHTHLTGGAVKNNGSKIFSFAGSYITDE
jgi:hypothetical protein